MKGTPELRQSALHKFSELTEKKKDFDAASVDPEHTEETRFHFALDAALLQAQMDFLEECIKSNEFDI